MNIRRLNADDAASFSPLRLRAVQEEPMSFSSSPEEHASYDLASLGKRISPLRDSDRPLYAVLSECLRSGRRVMHLARAYQKSHRSVNRGQLKVARICISHPYLSLLQYGATDERINAAWPAYEAALKAAQIRYEAHIDPGTQHGFNNDTTPRYDEGAEKLAWGRTIAFLDQHLR